VSDIRTDAVTSADGTAIVFDRSGVGPAVILVAGSLMDRADPILSGIAAGLARWFTVLRYDRRGHGDSGDTQPYAVERETEDLAALITAAGGSAAVFGGSSGAALALRAAGRNPAITRLALWEPPYHVDDSAPRLPHDFAVQLDRLVGAGRRADALELYMLKAVQATPEQVAGMRAQPFWPAMEAAAQTLAYEALVMGPDNALPAGLLARITQPTLVLNGGDSPAWMGHAGKAVADAIPGAVHRVLEAQAHNVSPQAIVPELVEFLVTALPARGLAWEPDAEAGGGQLQQYLARSLQSRDLGRAQLLELGQPRGVGVRALPAGVAQRDGIGPHLLPRLTQEALGAELVEGPQQPVEQGRRPGDPGQLVVLGGDPGGEHVVDRPVVGLAPGQQRGVVELLVGDHRQQRLRQVVVDVGIHAEQHVPQGRQPGRGAERDVPGTRRPPARHGGLQGLQVQVGEGDVPPLDPLGVGEAAALDLLGHRDRGPLIGGMKIAPLVAVGLQRLEHRRHPRDQLVDHAVIMIVVGHA